MVWSNVKGISPLSSGGVPFVSMSIQCIHTPIKIMTAITKTPSNLLNAVGNVLSIGNSIDEMTNPMSFLSRKPDLIIVEDAGLLAYKWNSVGKGNCLWLHEYAYDTLCEINNVVPFYGDCKTSIAR
jgi:hypothetical protein